MGLDTGFHLQPRITNSLVFVVGRSQPLRLSEALLSLCSRACIEAWGVHDFLDPFPHLSKSASPPRASDPVASTSSTSHTCLHSLLFHRLPANSEAWPYPHCPNFLASLSRPPSSRWVVAGMPNRLLTCIAPARLEKPLPLPVPRTALSAHQSENSECGHPNNFRFL